MDDQGEKTMTLAEFQGILAEELKLPRESLKPEASLIQDLHLDSLALASMMLRLEELGVSIPLESAWEIETVEDAYRAYLDDRQAGI
jgi:acyl carrier protein